jgi:RNA polymerase sigma factor (sigma-70 family)
VAGSLGDLLAGARRGDQRAWRRLVDEFSGLIWAITRAHRLCDADAADVAQITFLRLFEHLDRIKDPSRTGAWLATTARRECLRVLRQGARAVPRGDELPDVADARCSDHEATIIRCEQRAMLWAAFDQLPDGDRALLRLLMADPQPSYREISAALNRPIGSLGPTRARALDRLRRNAEALGLTDADALIDISG